MHEGSLLSTPSPAFVIYRLINDGHSDWCEVVPHYSFNLHLIISGVEHFFICLLAIHMFSLEKCLFLPIFQLGFFVIVELYELLVCFGDEALVHCTFYNYFSHPIVVFSFFFFLWFPLLCKSL